MTAPLTQTKTRPITIAILAMGGEGGGVLSDWIVNLAEHGGYLAQQTSIPGVAQRTGATIYYIELFPKSAVPKDREPVLALIPVPGDVDIVIASELMEAGRAVERGLVTPDRTALIASTNRVYAMSERTALSDGRVDEVKLLEACRTAAKRFYAFDMAAIAEATDSVISAVLFGALAGANVLPFQRMAFEAAIRRGGKGAAASVAAFTAGYEAAASGQAPPAVSVASPSPSTPAPHVNAALAELCAAAERDFPEPAQAVIRAGVERVSDYQNLEYARLYLQRLRPILEADQRHGDGSYRLLRETARQLALGMAYEDTIRVAELKIRPSRFQRVRDEVGISDNQMLEIVGFMHPRTQEIADTMPAPLGRWMVRTAWVRRLMDRWTRKGRVVKTSSIGGFLLLYTVAALKPLRPRSLRYGLEQQFLSQWLETVARTTASNYDLAVEVASCRNLVKGYGDTHERGRERFDMLMTLLPDLLDRPDGAAQLASLRKAANADDSGAALRSAVSVFKQAA